MRTAVLAAVLLSLCAAETEVVIGVQPLGDVPQEYLDIIFYGIDSVYDARVVFAFPVELPPEAFYTPRARYRAEKLLDYLDTGGDSACTKVVGIVTCDISTTKEPYEDWGIFGLGRLGGFCCVVSTFRLGRGAVTVQKFHERLIKVVNHELGHTFGIHHCSTECCLMEDAKGMIRTVDQERGAFCSQCRQRLSGFLR